MGFTTVSRISLGAVGGNTSSLFYTADIAVVVNQVGPNGQKVVGTQLRTASTATHANFAVLVAVTKLDATGVPIEFLLNDYHFVAIACPPYNITGWVEVP